MNLRLGSVGLGVVVGVVLPLVLGGVASADDSVIYLRKGSKVTGEIVERTESSIVVKTSSGQRVEVKRSDIALIEPKKSPGGSSDTPSSPSSAPSPRGPGSKPGTPTPAPKGSPTPDPGKTPDEPRVQPPAPGAKDAWGKLDAPLADGAANPPVFRVLAPRIEADAAAKLLDKIAAIENPDARAKEVEGLKKTVPLHVLVAMLARVKRGAVFDKDYTPGMALGKDLALAADPDQLRPLLATAIAMTPTDSNSVSVPGLAPVLEGVDDDAKGTLEAALVIKVRMALMKNENLSLFAGPMKKHLTARGAVVLVTAFAPKLVKNEYAFQFVKILVDVIPRCQDPDSVLGPIIDNALKCPELELLDPVENDQRDWVKPRINLLALSKGAAVPALKRMILRLDRVLVEQRAKNAPQNLEDLRERCVRALTDIGTADAFSLLLELYDQEAMDDERYRDAIASVFGRFKPISDADLNVIDQVFARMKPEDTKVYETLCKAMRALTGQDNGTNIDAWRACVARLHDERKAR